MFHRNPFAPLTRRELLGRMGAGFGSIGLASMMAGSVSGNANSNGALSANQNSPLFPKAPHFAPKAKRVIQLFMPGGPSQVDTFDHKPALEKHAGQRPEIVNRKTLRNTKNGLMVSPFKFQQYGQSGKWVS
ncbi:DUF1501 domain-containing protein, partial [Mariniblastus sp.]